MEPLQKRQMILNGKMSKVILTLALPIMFNNLFQSLYNLTDTYWISRLGSVEVAAMTFVWPVIFLMISVGMGISVAGTAIISQYIGSNRNKEARIVASQLFSFTVVISVFLTLLGFFAAPTILRLMRSTGELFEYSLDYLQIMYFDIPFLFIYFVFEAIKRSQGDTLTPMILSIFSVLLNMVLDPLFIFTFQWGIRGAAFATVLSKSVFSVYVIYTLFFGKSGIRLSRKYLRFKKDVLMQIIKVGLPATTGQSAAAFGFIILNVFVVAYGSSTLAAFGIGNRINSLAMMPVMGIGSALAAVIGQNLGAEQIQRAKTAFRTSLILSILFMSFGGLVLILYAQRIIALFTNDPEVLAQGTYYLQLICISIPFMAIFQVLVGTFQGSGHTIYAMFMDMGRLWGLRIPMILLFKHFTDWGSNAIWYAMILSNGIICVFGYLLYLKGDWQQQVFHKKSTA